MAIGHSLSAQEQLQQWRAEKVMGGLFRWIEELGRKDEEVREIVIQSMNCSPPSKWHETHRGGVIVVGIEAIVDSFDLSLTFADQTTAQKTFTERELRFTPA